MNTQNLFNSKQFRDKFTSDDIRRVKTWMQENGYLDGPVVMPGTMATALILLSLTVTDADLREYAEIILSAKTDYPEPESLQYLLSYILNDPMNSATVEKIEFNRESGQVRMRLIDDTEIFASQLPVILTPAFNQLAGIRWTRQELISLATDLQQDHDKGELVTETEFQKILKENKENYNHN